MPLEFACVKDFNLFIPALHLQKLFLESAPHWELQISLTSFRVSFKCGSILSSVASRYQRPQLRLGVKLLSDSSFSSGLFSCGQARVNATISPSPGCTALLSQCSALYARMGALWSMSGFSATLSVASFICYQKDRETNCVSVPTYSLGFIPEREINDSASS